MSRTYRGRHLPVIPGSARKIQFGVGRFGWDKRNSIIDPIIDSILGESRKFALRYSIRCQIENSIIWPVPTHHPWMRFMWCDNSAKTWWKRHGNRVMRRHNKGIVKTKIIDDEWTGHFMTYDEAFDTWSID